MLSDAGERLAGPAGEMDVGSFTGVRASDCGADRASCPVNDRGLAVELHRASFVVN
jgi:hypothetical protein